MKIKLSDNTAEEVKTKNGVFHAVSFNLALQLRLSFAEHMCSGKIFNKISFLGNTRGGREILEGTCKFSADLDTTRRLLPKETAITYSKNPREEVATYITT